MLDIDSSNINITSVLTSSSSLNSYFPVCAPLDIKEFNKVFPSYENKCNKEKKGIMNHYFMKNEKQNLQMKDQFQKQYPLLDFNLLQKQIGIDEADDGCIYYKYKNNNYDYLWDTYYCNWRTEKDDKEDKSFINYNCYPTKK